MWSYLADRGWLIAAVMGLIAGIFLMHMRQKHEDFVLMKTNRNEAIRLREWEHNLQNYQGSLDTWREQILQEAKGDQKQVPAPVLMGRGW